LAQTYPKLLLVNKDSVVAISIPQATEINVVYESLRVCDQLMRFQSTQIKYYEEIEGEKDKTIVNLNRQISLQDSINENMVLSNVVCNQKLKDKDKQIKWLKATRWFFIGATFFLGGVAIAN